jgi:hypothetical protein
VRDTSAQPPGLWDNALPQLPQNFLPCSLSKPQLEQIIAPKGHRLSGAEA